MAQREDSNEKITLLFPGGEHPPPSDHGDDDRQVEESGEVSEDGDPDKFDEADEGELSEKVVRLDFKREATRPSPRPHRPVVGEDAASKVKYQVFSEMIDLGMVMVTLDTRGESVVVPPKFQGFSELRLNFSYDFHIDDFDFDERGVRASLSFQGVRHFCDVPWTAVFMLYSHATSKVAVFEPDIGTDDDVE